MYKNKNIPINSKIVIINFIIILSYPFLLLSFNAKIIL
nr:MAG TPA: hypothetical protein [Caudoviricetes sp.]